MKFSAIPDSEIVLFAPDFKLFAVNILKLIVFRNFVQN